MRFIMSTHEPVLNTDILIKLNNGTIHEGEYVKVLDVNGKANAFYHIYKTGEYLSSIMVTSWRPMGDITDKYYADKEEYATIKEEEN